MNTIRYILLFNLIISLFVKYTECKQDVFMVKQERFDIFYQNTDLFNITGGLRYLDRKTKAMNLHVDIKEEWIDHMVSVVAHKWMNGVYVKYSAIQFIEGIEKILKYKWFDLQTLFLKSAKPPLVHPLKGKYHIIDWIPDSTAFPPYIPTGKYKVQLLFFRDKLRKDKVGDLHWYLNIDPIIRW